MDDQKTGKQRRFKPEVRQAQIVEAAKNLILENGLSWASSIRIAKVLGISQQAVFHPFKNKREILLATLSSVLDEIVQKTITPPSTEDFNDFFREAARRFYRITIADPRQARLLFEYLCAPPTENLRDEVQLIFSNLLDMSEALVKEGMAKGAFDEDTDEEIMAWIFVSLAVTLNIGTVLETPKFLSEDKALRAVEIILRAIKK